VPSHHGLRLHEQQALLPLAQHPAHRDPEDAVAVLEARARDAAFEDRDLVAQGGVLDQ
jgi:hypothetical protein